MRPAGSRTGAGAGGPVRRQRRAPVHGTRFALLPLLTLITLGLLGVSAFVGPTHAAEDTAERAGTAPTTLPTLEQRRQRLLDFTPVAPAPPASGVALAPETRAAYETALRAYYDYRVRGYEQRLQAFEWQGWSTKAIFFAVLGLVLAGVVFAAVQFGVGLRRTGTAGETSSELAIDLKGVKVSSPVLGVVLLTISLAFFYLYLVYVYPIMNVF